MSIFTWSLKRFMCTMTFHAQIHRQILNWKTLIYRRSCSIPNLNSAMFIDKLASGVGKDLFETRV